MEIMTKIFLVVALCVAFATILAVANADEVEEGKYRTTVSSTDDLLSKEEESSSRRVVTRLLAQYNLRASMTCNNFPRICRDKGSPGPDCCRKQCVDVDTDNLNCGQCGMKCKYGEACCRGNCVNVMYDPKNCGSCKNMCKKGSFCRYGMCSYA